MGKEEDQQKEQKIAEQQAKKEQESPETTKEPEVEEPESEEPEAEEPEAEKEAQELAEELPKEEEETAEAEEEEAKPSRKKKTDEEEIVEERTYTVPLSRAWIMPANKRAPRAIRILRGFITKHMKLEARKEAEGEEEEEPARLVISNEVNQKVWNRGIEKPPRKIRVRAAKDKEGNVTVYLAEGD
jgi:large subunit ribosomal protein L31e